MSSLNILVILYQTLHRSIFNSSYWKKIYYVVNLLWQGIRLLHVFDDVHQNCCCFKYECSEQVIVKFDKGALGSHDMDSKKYSKNTKNYDS